MGVIHRLRMDKPLESRFHGVIDLKELTQ